MIYRIKPEVIEAVDELGGRLDELKQLEYPDFADAIWPLLKKILFHLDTFALPFVDFTSWYEAQTRSAPRPGGGHLDWPELVAERVTTQLRLIFLIMGSDGQRRGFRLAFIPDSQIYSENVAGYVRRLLQPFVWSFREFVESDDVRTDPFVAEVWSGAQIGPTRVTEVELETIRHRRDEFEHFIDCVGDRVIAEVETGEKRVPSKLTAGEAEMFRAAFARSQSKDGFFYPDDLELDVVSKSSRAQVFKTMRTKLDFGNHGVFRLFKSRRTGEPHKLEYRFAPGEDVRWCVILPVEAKV